MQAKYGNTKFGMVLHPLLVVPRVLGLNFLGLLAERTSRPPSLQQKMWEEFQCQTSRQSLSFGPLVTLKNECWWAQPGYLADILSTNALLHPRCRHLHCPGHWTNQLPSWCDSWFEDSPCTDHTLCAAQSLLLLLCYFARERGPQHCRSVPGMTIHISVHMHLYIHIFI